MGKKLRPVYKDHGSPRCDYCGARFMGEERAEVVDKATDEVWTIHMDCYNSATMEVA